MGIYEKGVISVQIFGKEYPVESDQNREYVQKLAEYVDRKMSEIAGRGETFSSGKIAVQACLNIADDLMRTKNEKEQLIRTIQERISNVAKMIEDRLGKKEVCPDVKERTDG